MTEQEQQELKDLRAENAMLRAERIGIHKFLRGEKVGVTTSIADTIEYGYGELDVNGFWEYPVPRELVHFVNPGLGDLE